MRSLDLERSDLRFECHEALSQADQHEVVNVLDEQPCPHAGMGAGKRRNAGLRNWGLRCRTAAVSNHLTKPSSGCGRLLGGHLMITWDQEKKSDMDEGTGRYRVQRGELNFLGRQS